MFTIPESISYVVIYNKVLCEHPERRIILSQVVTLARVFNSRYYTVYTHLHPDCLSQSAAAEDFSGQPFRPDEIHRAQKQNIDGTQS